MATANPSLLGRSRQCVWKCLSCRCDWVTGRGDWEEAPIKDDDTGKLHLKRQQSPRLEAITIGQRSPELLSEDEGFFSAVESDEDAPRPHAPRHRPIRPRLSEDAHEQQVAEYEELTMASVTSTKIDEVCKLAGIDPHDVKCRLTARRFAIANGGKVNAAVKQMATHKVWLAETRPNMLKTYDDDPLLVKLGYDKIGHPLYLYDGPRLNAISRSSEDLVLQLATVIQRAIDKLESGDDLLYRGCRPAWRLQKFTLILSLPKGSEPDFRKIGPVLKLFQNQFPERLYRALIFPIGKWTPFFWNLVKPFLDARTVQKIKLLEGGNTPPELLDFVSPEYLPEEFGGTMKD